MGWRDNFGVHPAADVFPMMPEEELDALAADIKANGLRTPISFFGVAESERKDDSEVSLADGRNRLEAMDRAGVELKAGDLELLRGLSQQSKSPSSSARTSAAVTSPRRSRPT